MTLQELIKLAKERETSITGLAFEMWDHLNENTQRALARELCALYKDNEEDKLLENLNEYYPELMLPKEIDVSLKQLSREYKKDYDRELLEEDLEEYLSDYITNKYGYCHLGFEYEIEMTKDNIRCYNIEWDIY